MATNGLGGQKKSEIAIAATTVFCNAGSISETAAGAKLEVIRGKFCLIWEAPKW